MSDPLKLQFFWIILKSHRYDVNVSALRFILNLKKKIVNKEVIMDFKGGLLSYNIL